MEEKGRVEVRAVRALYQPKNPEDVYRVTNPRINIAPGETFDITIDCKNGFKVFVPYPEFFETIDFEAKEVDQGEIGEAPKDKWWRASMTRKTGNNNTDIREMAYCIYSKDLDNFAVGESPPKMTIEP
jgi:hypothetical protein